MNLDYATVAQTIGFPVTARYSQLDGWHENAKTILAEPGPRLICLAVKPEVHQPPAGGLEPIDRRIEELRAQIVTAVA